MSISTPHTPTHASQARADERRADPRGRCLLQGRVLFPDNSRTREVMIRNVGAHGALLVGDRMSDLSSDFTLGFTARGAERKARLVWTSNAKAGLEFEPA